MAWTEKARAAAAAKRKRGAAVTVTGAKLRGRWTAERVQRGRLIRAERNSLRKRGWTVQGYTASKGGKDWQQPRTKYFGGV